MTDVRQLRELAEQRYEDFVDALREMVNVDCRSYTPEGVNAIADLCQARFERGGWAVERMRHEPTGDQERLGDLVIGRLDGGGRARVLMIGHTDTVLTPDRRRTSLPHRGRQRVRAGRDRYGGRSLDRFLRGRDPAGGRLRRVRVHLHTREDEFSFVLEGRWGFMLGSSVVYAEPSDLVFKPRDVWHTFWNATDRRARLLEIISRPGSSSCSWSSMNS